jgi:hypothetical protein
MRISLLVEWVDSLFCLHKEEACFEAGACHANPDHRHSRRYA